VYAKFEAVVEYKNQPHPLKNLEKNPIEGFNNTVIRSGIRRQGASISTVIQELI